MTDKDKLQTQIDSVNQQIHCLKEYLRGLVDARDFLSSKKGGKGGHIIRGNLELVYKLLKNSPRALHLTEILALLESKHGIKMTKNGLANSLLYHIKRNHVFCVTGPNTYSLLGKE